MGFGREVAATALARAVLIGRGAVTVTAAAAGLLLVHDRRPVVTTILLVVVITVGQLAALSRWPGLARRPILVVLADLALTLAVLAVSHGSVAYFAFAAGAGALAGALLGLRAWPLWAAHAALGFGVIGVVLRRAETPPDIVTFVVGFPMAGALAGVGTALATTALTRYLELTTQLVSSAQRSAVESERARLARELHDSVTKTLRGVSLAALALPSALRRQPVLAEHLAGTVLAGATAAARQARELLTDMRHDEGDLAASLDELCRGWSASSGVAVDTALTPVEAPIEVSYELVRIVREALTNVARHGCARWVGVRLMPQPYGLWLEISDDGVGFGMPADLSTLQSAGHFGIVGMAERARTVGGELQVESAPGAGTRIMVRVPLQVPDDRTRGRRRSIGAR